MPQTLGVHTAFPRSEELTYGLSKREYFAAMALTGLADNDDTPEGIATEAVQIADALIDALNKTL